MKIVKYIFVHYAIFYYISWGYIAIALALGYILNLSEHIVGMTILPLNLVTVPVFIAIVKDWKNVHFLIARSSVVLLIVTLSTVLW